MYDTSTRNDNFCYSIIFLPPTVSADLSMHYDSVSEWKVEKILLLLSTINEVLLPKVAKSIKLKVCQMKNDKNGEKKTWKPSLYLTLYYLQRGRWLFCYESEKITYCSLFDYLYSCIQHSIVALLKGGKILKNPVVFSRESNWLSSDYFCA